MKKVVSGILAVAMLMAMLCCLAGCGDSEKKQEAVAAFNETSASFNEVANLVNANASAIDGEFVSSLQEMSALLTEYKGLLEGDAEISDEKYDEMIAWFKSTLEWSKAAKTQIEAELSGTGDEGIG